MVAHVTIYKVNVMPVTMGTCCPAGPVGNWLGKSNQLLTDYMTQLFPLEWQETTKFTPLDNCLAPAWLQQRFVLQNKTGHKLKIRQRRNVKI